MIERFYQDNKVKDIRIGDKRILRVLNQGKAVYPNVVRDGLVLYYDFRGYTNDNLKRGIAYDLSGNGNHGELKNFAFSEGSGYDGQGLVFDGVDDYIQLPTLGLDADDFTVMMNDKIFSYRGEDVAQVVDGDVEIGGRNLYTNTVEPFSVVGSGNKNQITENTIRTVGLVNVGVKVGDFLTVSYRWSAEDLTGEGFGGGSFYIRSSVPPYTLDPVKTQVNDNNTEGYRSYVLIVDEDTLDVNTFQPRLNFIPTNVRLTFKDVKIEKGNKPTDWTPAPEDLETTTFKPLFDKKIKSALYWNRALTDEELLQVYNTQIKRI